MERRILQPNIGVHAANLDVEEGVLHIHERVAQVYGEYITTSFVLVR